MNTCRQCGEDIVWAQRDDGRWLPPLDAASFRPLSLPEGVLVAKIKGLWTRLAQTDQELTMASFHHCPPVSGIVEKTRPLVFNYPDVWSRYWSSPRRIQLMQQPCPYCSARVGEPCVRKDAARSFGDKYLMSAHTERIQLTKDFGVHHIEADWRILEQANTSQLEDFFSGVGKDLFDGLVPSSTQGLESAVEEVGSSVVPVEPQAWWLDLISS